MERNISAVTEADGRRSISSLFALLAFGGFGSIAAHAQPAPVSLENCADGRPRTVVRHAGQGAIPSDATAVDCGDGQTCYVSVVSTCLDLIGVTEVLPASREPAERPPLRPAPTTPPQGAKPLDPGQKFAQPPDTQPINPYGKDSPRPAPTVEHCSPGEGWDFETLARGKTLPTYASLDDWKGDGNSGSPFENLRNADVDIVAAPVYGNAVPIDRIQPPGWTPATRLLVGGDYWLHSQSINQHGAFWLSSFYRRYSWGQHPGVDWGEAAIGTLTSPECVLRSRYLTFRASGGFSAGERIEVQVRGGRPREYFGIEFVDSAGVYSFGAHQLNGQMGYATQSPPVPLLQTQAFPPPTSGWTVMRTVTPDGFVPGGTIESEWMKLYVMDLEPFNGQQIRIRIVDDRNSNCAIRKPGGCAMRHPAHINVDDVLFSDEPPQDVNWYSYATLDPRGVGCPPHARPHGEERVRCQSPIGVVPSQPPLWGITDAHAHPMANFAFGGHVFWGDPRDPESKVYDCSQTLDKIPGPGGHPRIVPGEQTSCYLNGDFVAAVAGAAQLPCGLLGAVPILGGVGVALCVGVIEAAAAIAANTPTLRLLRLHGARMGASGAVAFGVFLTDALQAVLDLIGDDSFQGIALQAIPGLMPEIDKSPFTKKDMWQLTQFVLNTGWLGKLDWYPDDAKWHGTTGVGKLHNRYVVDGIKRAYYGGLRLAVWDVINSRVFALAADGNPNAPDWQALKDQTDAAKAIVASLGVIAQIAYSPEEADAIVRSGRLAVVLGSEVDELGRMRPSGLPWPRSPHTAGDSMQKQVDDLWELGIRKISPVHSSNNPIGGAAVFTKDYVANNHFLNSTPLDAPPSLTDLPTVKAILDLGPNIVKKLVLGDIVPLSSVGGDGKQPWNPEGWFEFGALPGATSITDAGGDWVTYRVGQDDPPSPSLNNAAGWLPPKDVLGDQIKTVRVLNDISYIVKTDDKCQTKNLVFPGHADEFTPAVNSEFVANAGHRNKLGIFSDGAEDGNAFLRAAMKRGMLIAADHMSQQMRIDFYALAAQYAAEAGQAPCIAGQACPDYAVMGEHSTLREIEKEGSSLPHLIGDFGSNDETTKPLKEIDYIADRNGMIGVFPRPTLIAPNTSGGQCHRHSDCAAWDGQASTVACDNGKCVAEPPQAALLNPDGVTATVDTRKYPIASRDFELPIEVENDCDGSSKSFAAKYLIMMQHMKGHGLTFTTDMNGLNSTGYPRFGMRIPGSAGCGKGDRATTLPYLRPTATVKKDWPTRMRELQNIETSGIWYTSYKSRVPLVSPLVANIQDPKRPDANKRWKVVAARQINEAREDHLPLYARNDRGDLPPDYVYFNDYGPDLDWGHWYKQSGNAKGAQLYAMIPENRRGSGWDFNLDGFQQIGSLPDLLQDMRNIGVQWEQMEPLMHGADDLIASWKKSRDLGQLHP